MLRLRSKGGVMIRFYSSDVGLFGYDNLIIFLDMDMAA